MIEYKIFDSKKNLLLLKFLPKCYCFILNDNFCLIIVQTFFLTVQFFSFFPPTGSSSFFHSKELVNVSNSFGEDFLFARVVSYERFCDVIYIFTNACALN